MILFPYQMGFRRLLTINEPMSEMSRKRLDRMFRTKAWRDTYDSRLRNEISPPEARDQFVALYEDDLKALGYGWVRHQLIEAPKVGSVARREMYHLFFATDHEAGDRIMEDVFSRPYVLDFPLSQQRPLFEV